MTFDLEIAMICSHRKENVWMSDILGSADPMFLGFFLYFIYC